jgi:uncharacterized protein YfeS
MDEVYGIDQEHAHPRAIELIPDEFFWDCADELAPFGSDEGDTALNEYRRFKQENPDKAVIDCMKWTIEGVGEMDMQEYNSSLLSAEKIKAQIEDPNFDDQQYIFTLDISVIATGFGQLVDEGKIDGEVKPFVDIALERQILWAKQYQNWQSADRYIRNLEVLKKALVQA